LCQQRTDRQRSGDLEWIAVQCDLHRDAGLLRAAK
jgi:hypothetical protein